MQRLGIEPLLAKSLKGKDKQALLKVKLGQMMQYDRLKHSFRVAQTALELALLHGANPVHAYTAGLLHDCARELSGSELRRRAQEANLQLVGAEERAPVLLHGRIGAVVARQVFEVEEKSILSAIAVHTTGASEMTHLSRVLFVADYVEPGRCFDAARVARSIAGNRLEAAVDYKLINTARHLRLHGKTMHPRFREALASRGLCNIPPRERPVL